MAGAYAVLLRGGVEQGDAALPRDDAVPVEVVEAVPDGGDGDNRHPNRMIHMPCRRLVLLLLRGVSSYECEQLLPSHTITLVPPVKIIFAG